MKYKLDKYKTILTIGFFTLLASTAKSNDTTLVKVINLPYSIYTIANDSIGNIWISGSRGLQYYDFDKESFISSDPSFKAHIISEEGEIMPFVGGKGQLNYPWDKFLPWSKRLPQKSIRITVAIDKYGYYWVSTGNQIFIFTIEQRFNNTLEGFSTRGIHREDEYFYINTYRGILKNDSLLFQRPTFAVGDIEEFNGDLYFAWGGLIRYHPENKDSSYLNFESYSGEIKNPKPLAAQCLEQFKDTLWLGTNYGLGYIDSDSVIMVSNHPDVQDLAITKDGFFLAGTSLQKPRIEGLPIPNFSFPECMDCNGVYMWKNEQLDQLDIPEFNYRHINYSDDTYYFASDSGVVVWNGEKVTNVISEEDGLTSNLTCLTIKDKHGFLWVSTFSGLNRINLTNGNITHYLKNIEFNYRSSFQSDSLIYLGSVQGIYTFNPDDFLGDDIIPSEPLSSQQLLLILGSIMFAIFLVLLYFIKRYYLNKVQSREAQLEASERKLFFLQIDKVVYNTDDPLTVKNLAENLEMSERTLYRKFEEYGHTPGSYLKILRIKKAKYLLNNEKTSIPFNEIAKKVGYTEGYLKKLLEQ